MRLIMVVGGGTSPSLSRFDTYLQARLITFEAKKAAHKGSYSITTKLQKNINFGCMTSNFIYLSISTLRSRSL